MYGLFHRLVRTSQGKMLLRQYFVRPSLDISTIADRLHTISMFLRPENANCLESLSKNLSHVKNMHQIMTQLQKGATNGFNKGGASQGIWATIRQVDQVTITNLCLC